MPKICKSKWRVPVFLFSLFMLSYFAYGLYYSEYGFVSPYQKIDPFPHPVSITIVICDIIRSYSRWLTGKTFIPMIVVKTIHHAFWMSGLTLWLLLIAATATPTPKATGTP